MIFDGPVPRREPEYYVKELNAFEKQLGWFWFKGKKIPFEKGAGIVQIPYMESTADYIARLRK